MTYLTDYERKKIEESGCPHIGVLPPSKFDCIDCDDNAENCNCFDCMGGVFCQECNAVITVGCSLVDCAYREKKEASVVEEHKP